MPHIGNLYPSSLLLTTTVISVDLTEYNIKYKCVVVALFNQEKLDVFGFNYSLSFGYLECRAFPSCKYAPDSYEPLPCGYSQEAGWTPGLAPHQLSTLHRVILAGPLVSS